MATCSFCNAELKNKGKEIARQSILKMMDDFPTMGGFTQYYGFPNTLLIQIMGNDKVISYTLCTICANKLEKKKS